MDPNTLLLEALLSNALAPLVRGEDFWANPHVNVDKNKKDFALSQLEQFFKENYVSSMVANKQWSNLSSPATRWHYPILLVQESGTDPIVSKMAKCPWKMLLLQL